MRWGPTILCGWPGLARLWTKGHWPSFGLQSDFRCWSIWRLISTFVWPQLLGDSFPVVAWPLIVVVVDSKCNWWLIEAFQSYCYRWVRPDQVDLSTERHLVYSGSRGILKRELDRTLKGYLSANWRKTQETFNPVCFGNFVSTHTSNETAREQLAGNQEI